MELPIDTAVAQVLPHPVGVEGAPEAGLDCDLARGVALPATAELDPRARGLVLAPGVVEGADAADDPRPEERLAGALDEEVRKDEHLVEVAVAGDGLAERVTGRGGDRVLPYERDLLQERVRDGLGLMLHVWAVSPAEAFACVPRG